MKDALGRTVDYMRISVTDCCNLNCIYCMPKADTRVQDKTDILSFNEIAEIVSCGASLGISRVKLTGGEPLMRKNLSVLTKMIKAVPGIEKVTLTTNGVLLKQYLKELIESGADGINISLDTVDRKKYEELTGKDCLPQVLEGIRQAAVSGISVKINTVLLDMGESWKTRWQKIVSFAEEYPIDVRFIEMMPIGYGKKFKTAGSGELFQEIQRHYPQIKRDEQIHGPGPAVYYRIPGWKGSIGFISPIHGKFCSACNRVRLTAKGYLKTCLCYHEGVDLLPLLRSGWEAEERLRQIAASMEHAIVRKPSAHCFESPEQMTEKENMFMIGG